MGQDNDNYPEVEDGLDEDLRHLVGSENSVTCGNRISQPHVARSMRKEPPDIKKLARALVAQIMYHVEHGQDITRRRRQ